MDKAIYTHTLYPNDVPARVGQVSREDRIFLYGSIEVARQPSSGSTFTLRLPTWKPSEPPGK